MESEASDGWVEVRLDGSLECSTQIEGVVLIHDGHLGKEEPAIDVQDGPREVGSVL